MGVGTAILAVFTAGLSLLAIPFYVKRCSICRSPAVSVTGPDGRVRSGAADQAGTLGRQLGEAQGELEAANAEIEHLTEELEFYRKLLDDPTRSGRQRPGSQSPG